MGEFPEKRILAPSAIPEYSFGYHESLSAPLVPAGTLGLGNVSPFLTCITFFRHRVLTHCAADILSSGLKLGMRLPTVSVGAVLGCVCRLCRWARSLVRATVLAKFCRGRETLRGTTESVLAKFRQGSAAEGKHCEGRPNPSQSSTGFLLGHTGVYF